MLLKNTDNKVSQRLSDLKISSATDDTLKQFIRIELNPNEVFFVIIVTSIVNSLMNPMLLNKHI